MSFIIRICYIIALMATNAWSRDSFSLLQPVQHEPRFTKFELSVNQSYGKVLKSSIKQYYGKQALNVHFIFHEEVTLHHMNFELNKCQEHYIDCVNVRTFDFANLCGNEKAVRIFYTIGYQNRELSCELQVKSVEVQHFWIAELVDSELLKVFPRRNTNSEYILKNITIRQEIAPMFFTPTEKWWELSLKWRISFYNKENNFILKVLGDMEIITYRMRNRKPSMT